MLESTQRDRQRALDNAIASQRLEGLEPDAQTMAELGKVVRGELKIADVLDRLQTRIAAGEFHRIPTK